MKLTSGDKVPAMSAVRIALLAFVVVLAPRWAEAQSAGEGDTARTGDQSSADKAEGRKANQRAKKSSKATKSQKATKGKKARKGEGEATGAEAPAAVQVDTDAPAGDAPSGGEKTDDTALPPGVAATPGSPDAPTGSEENPDAPITDFDRPVEAEVARAAPVADDYPIERALRPITLPRRMTEVTLDAPNSFNPYVQSGLLGVHHGITNRIQAGLRYGTGTLFDGEYFTGKTVAVDGEFQIFHWLSAQLAVPFMFDPTSVGVTVGAPMKFTVQGRLRFDLFRDLVTFKVNRFAPSVWDAAANDALVLADATNTVLPDGEINANAAASWQLQPHMSIEGRFGVKARDFEFQSDSPTLFDLGLIYSSTNKIDIGGRMGFADLNHTDSTFGLWLLAAVRI